MISKGLVSVSVSEGQVSVLVPDFEAETPSLVQGILILKDGSYDGLIKDADFLLSIMAEATLDHINSLAGTLTDMLVM